MSDDYMELNARFAFSFLEGAALPEDLIATCADFGMPAMALIDRDGVYGAPRFHMAAKKAGIRAHIGAEVTCTDGHRYPLLAESRTGYQNLCRLITRMKLLAKKGEGAATPQEFAEFAEGLVCLVSWTRPISNRPQDAILPYMERGRMYVELQRHHNREQEAHNQALIQYPRPLNLPLLP